MVKIDKSIGFSTAATLSFATSPVSTSLLVSVGSGTGAIGERGRSFGDIISGSVPGGGTSSSLDAAARFLQTLAPIRIIAQIPNTAEIVTSAISPLLNLVIKLLVSSGLSVGEMLVVGDVDIVGVAVGNMDATATGAVLGTDDGNDDEEKDGEDETEGRSVTVAIGDKDGVVDDDNDGEDEGESLVTVGLDDAKILGAPDGLKEGPPEGKLVDGVDDGDEDAAVDGPEDGDKDAVADGVDDGDKDAITDGLDDGDKDAISDGVDDGDEDSIREGIEDGTAVGNDVGVDDGVCEGTSDTSASTTTTSSNFLKLL